MPKLPRLTPRKLIKLLEENGFKKDHVTGSHYTFYKVETKKIVVVPYHNKDLPIGTIKSILDASGIDLDK
jgi:predicted RNA binding protein YcfA (HicA-like mRNA interferase family)